MPKPIDHKFKFAVIRYVPNFMREEFINAGLVLYDMTGQTIIGRVIDRDRKLKCFDSEGNFKHFQKYVNDLMAYIDVAFQEKLQIRQDVRLSDTLQKAFSMATVPSAGLISFSDIKGGLTANIQKEFDTLFEKFVGRKEAAPEQKIISHHSVVKSVYHILWDYYPQFENFPFQKKFYYNLTETDFTCEVTLVREHAAMFMKVLSLRTKKNYPHEMQNILSSITVLSDLQKNISHSKFGSIIYFSPKYDKEAQDSEFVRLQKRFRESNLECIKATKPDIERYLIDNKYIRVQ